jgi:putative FmdB family regulatory protein
MPTYDYRCDSCGYRFEEIQSIKAEPLRTCPECKQESLRRLLGTGAGLIFKGSGFYITDYKKNGNGREEKSADKKEKESSKDSKSDSSNKTSSAKKDTTS